MRQLERPMVQEDCEHMTNTLHRYGDAASFRDDYVIFAIAAKGERSGRAAEAAPVPGDRD